LNLVWADEKGVVSKVKLFVASRQYHFSFIQMIRYKTEIKSLAINGNVSNVLLK